VETSVHVFSVYVNKSHNAVQVDLIELLDSNDQAIRGSAVGVLADIAQEHPDIVVDLAGALAGRLSDASEAARTNASIALNRAGETDSQTTRTQDSALVTARDDETSLGLFDFAEQFVSCYLYSVTCSLVGVKRRSSAPGRRRLIVI